MKPLLEAGMTLSYSASSRQTGPDGYRIQRQGPAFLPLLIDRWPEIGQIMGKKAAVIINAYPAQIGSFDFGIYVDTYLSLKTALRSLQLAAAQERTAILLGQPLFLAEIIFRALSKGIALPQNIFFASGGYYLPQSLQQVLHNCLQKKSIHCLFLHCYGVAEVDAACLVGMQRLQTGEIVYFPRAADIEVKLDSGELYLRRQQARAQQAWFPTGDLAVSHKGGYLFHPAASKLASEVRRELEAWSENEWQRRTGYLNQEKGLTFQVREGQQPVSQSELSHFIFAEAWGFSWLEKPHWGE